MVRATMARVCWKASFGERHRPDVVGHGVRELGTGRPDGAAGFAADDGGAVSGLAADFPAAGGDGLMALLALA